ncbi:MAG: zinc-finger domain-containing protein [Alphaproteobacteria bacterium]|nr:MAG: zinc-finger domain-containing protein [Alphaproteobacteria bacterium]
MPDERRSDQPKNDHVYVDEKETQISCGGAGILSHPKIYLAFGHRSVCVCPYCGRLFARKTHTA